VNKIPYPISLSYFFILFVVLVVVSGPARAHQVLPSVVTVTLQESGTYLVSVNLNAEALIAGIGPDEEDTDDSVNAGFYDALRLLPPRELEAEFAKFLPVWLDGVELAFDGERSAPEFRGIVVPPVGNVSRQRISRVALEGSIPAGATELTWQYRAAFGDSAVRVGSADNAAIQTDFLQAGQISKPFPLGAELVPLSRSEVFVDYTWLGFTHILPKGLDHILFVLGIFLLSLKLRPLLWQVTAFTVAHSITLAMSLFGLVSLPANIVEPLIAASIVYVAVENILTDKLQPWRIYVVFAFGLLHGLGFAGVLTELGLPRSEFVTALIAFNVGVELGQLTVIVMAFLAVGLWFRNREWYRQRIVIPCSLLIALTGAYWTVERVLG